MRGDARRVRKRRSPRLAGASAHGASRTTLEPQISASDRESSGKQDLAPGSRRLEASVYERHLQITAVMLAQLPNRHQRNQLNQNENGTPDQKVLRRRPVSAIDRDKAICKPTKQCKANSQDYAYNDERSQCCSHFILILRYVLVLATRAARECSGRQAAPDRTTRRTQRRVFRVP